MKITSYKTACKFLAKETPSAPKVSHMPKREQEFYIAIHEITTIIKAKNKQANFKPDWADANQRKWRPWFRSITNSKGLFSGFVFAGSGYVWSHTFAFGGSRFALATEEDADFVGKKFIKIWNKILTE